MLENKILQDNTLDHKELVAESLMSEQSVGPVFSTGPAVNTIAEFNSILKKENAIISDTNVTGENELPSEPESAELPPLQPFPTHKEENMTAPKTTGDFSWPQGQDGKALSGHYSPDGIYMSGPMPSTAAGFYGPGGAYHAGPMVGGGTTGFSSWGPTPSLMFGYSGEAALQQAGWGAPGSRPIMTGLPQGLHPLEVIQQRARAVGQAPLQQGAPIPQDVMAAQTSVANQLVDALGQLARSGQLPTQQAATDVAAQALRSVAIPDPAASLAWLANAVASGLASLSALSQAYSGSPEMQASIQDARARIGQALSQSGFGQQQQQPQQPQQQQQSQQAGQQQAALIQAVNSAAQNINQLADAVSRQAAPQAQQAAAGLRQAAQQAAAAAEQARLAVQSGNAQQLAAASGQAQQLLDASRQVAGQFMRA